MSLIRIKFYQINQTSLSTSRRKNSMSDNSMSTGSSVKSFWDKKEGKYGKTILLIAAAMAVGVGIFVFGFVGLTLVPIINTIFKNIFNMGVTATALAVPIILASNRDFRRFVSGIFKDAMRKLAKVRKAVDRMNDYVDYLKGCLEQQKNGIQGLQTVIEQNENLIQVVRDEINESMAIAAAAEKKKDMVTLSFQKEKIGRKELSNKKIQKQLNLAKPLLQRIKELKVITNNTVDDTKDKILMMTRENKSTVALAEAMGGAMGVIGDTEERAAFESAMEQLAEENGQKVGQIKMWMEESESYLSTESLKSALFEEEGSRKLEEYLKKPILDFSNGNTLTMDGTGAVQVEQGSMPSQAFQSMSDSGSNYLSSILKNKKSN